MTQKSNSFQRIFLLVLLALTSAWFLWMIRPFICTVLLAAILTSLMYPLFERVVRTLRGRRRWGSTICVIVVLLLIVGPVMVVLSVVAMEAMETFNGMAEWLKTHRSLDHEYHKVLRQIPGAAAFRPLTDQILERTSELFTFLGQFLFTRLSSFTAGTALFLVHIVLLLYTMYFLFLDGPRILRRILYLLPLSSDQEGIMLSKFRSVAKATLKGTVVIGILQAGAAGGALWLAGIPNVLLWTVVMSLTAMIPVLGTPIVWIPAVVYLLFLGETGKAIAVAAWCGLVVGTIDNFLRPILVGKDTAMHELLILFSSLGGIVLFGPVGLIFGPLVATLFITLWDLYGEAFEKYLPEVASEIAPPLSIENKEKHHD